MSVQLKVKSMAVYFKQHDTASSS